MSETERVWGEIPVRTWRWLGVNESRVPERVALSSPSQRLITVPDGQSVQTSISYIDEPSSTVRVEIGEGATLALVKSQLAQDDIPRADNIEVRCAAGARFIYTVVEAGGSVSASSLTVELAGDESSADVAALYFADGTRRVDMNYLIRQCGKNTNAQMTVHGALMDSCEKIFRGTLDFVRGATGSYGREHEEVVLLSPDVRNRSVPLMLSGEADVDGHHSVTIGRLDEERLFYLMSRGIDYGEARRLAVEAEIAPVLARIPDEELVMKIRSHIEGRLAVN